MHSPPSPLPAALPHLSRPLGAGEGGCHAGRLNFALCPGCPEGQEGVIDLAELTHKQALFVEAFLGTAKGNATEAARIAGYADPEARTGRLQRSPAVRAALRERVDRMAMTADEVLARLAEQARGSIEDCLTFPNGATTPMLDLEKARRIGKLHLVRSLRPGKFGVAVELYDAQAALALLGRYHGLFIERHEHEVRRLSDEELIARAAGFVSGDAAAGAYPAGQES